jgi:hypothetical protein
MVDVPIYVAVITAAAGIIGAAIPQVSMDLRAARKDDRDRRDRQAAQLRQACADLLRAAADLRTQIANNHTYRGDRAAMVERLEKVRQYAADTQVSSVSVGMLMPRRLAQPARRVADAAGRLAEAAVRNTNLDLGGMDPEPNYDELDQATRAFEEKALGHAAS